MQKRYRLRATMMELQASAGPHWRLADWRKEVLQVDAAGYREQTGMSEGLSAAEGHTAGKLHYWQPGTALPAIGDNVEHRSSLPKRAVQRMIHPHLVRWMDSFRESWSAMQPQLLTAEIQSRL